MNESEQTIWSAKIAGMPLKVWIALVIELALFAALLFVSAGTLNWPAAWVFLALFALSVIPASIDLAKNNPDLLDERMKSPIQPNQPLWDRVLVMTLFVFVVPGLDLRWDWSRMPLWLQIVGSITLLVTLYLLFVTMRHNPYLASVVRVQKERGHKVISTGPYAIVRHPFYAAAIPFFPAIGLLLGSWWAVLLSLLVIAILAYRAVKEEQLLERELDGYANYMKKVRYRLIPYVW
jgi:protein-S-isoprenylcysteine O-methyltransferase Ste14